jgi:prolyl oligopeptidase
MARLSYPHTPSGHDVEEAAGVQFPDPYRWLEREDDASREWLTAQNQLT